MRSVSPRVSAANEQVQWTCESDERRSAVRPSTARGRDEEPITFGKTLPVYNPSPAQRQGYPVRRNLWKETPVGKLPPIPQAWNDQSGDFGGSRFAQAALPPANSDPVLPAGVDWEFVNEREGVLTQGYVPEDRERRPHANSGVTIAAGFDLGRRSVADLQRLGLDDDLVTRLTPYLGLRGHAARDYLNANPLRITSQQQQAIDTPTFVSSYNRLADNYNAAQTTGTRFQDLPRGAQTAIFSLAHQYGSNLAARTPNFWNQITTGRWQDAYNNLRSFGDAHDSRRREEGRRMLDAINSGRLPAPRPGR